MNIKCQIDPRHKQQWFIGFTAIQKAEQKDGRGKGGEEQGGEGRKGKKRVSFWGPELNFSGS